MTVRQGLAALAGRALAQRPADRIGPFAAAARARWPAASAILFYGSARRQPDDPGREPDFYILFDSLQDSGQGALARAANAALPPNVRFLRTPDGFAKCALMTLAAFERAAGAGLAPTIWGRFCQPAILVHARNAEARARVAAACGDAIDRFLRAAAPLADPGDDAAALWIRGLAASYGAELRAEGADRARELFEADRAFYLEAAAMFRDGRPEAFQGRRAARTAWALRRAWGKLRTALHVLKASFTVGEGGLDYVLSKLARHSGVTVEPTAWERAHPRLAAPGLAWRLWRRGAFR